MAVATESARAVKTFPLDRLAAVFLVALLPLRALSPVASSLLSLGVLAAAAIILVPIIRARNYRFMGMLGGAFLAVLVSVPVLWVLVEDRVIRWDIAWTGAATVLVAATHLVVLLWARSLLGIRAIVMLYSVGLIGQAFMTSFQGFPDNPWKFGLAFPVTALLLAVMIRGHRMLTIVALVVIAGISLNYDYRSFIVFAVLTLIVWLWASRKSVRPRRVWWEIAVFAGIAWVMYLTFVQLALAGWLGERNRAVTSAQIESAGSALAGGRVESAASFALFAHRPLGYGPGVAPNSDDFSVGVGALVSRGVNVDGTYVQDYLFGSGIKLHSVAADMWVNYGLAGLFLAGVLVWIMLGSVARSLRSSTTPALLYFLPIVGVWDMAFSPIGTNLWEVLLIVACIIPAKGMSEALSGRPATVALS